MTRARRLSASSLCLFLVHACALPIPQALAQHRAQSLAGSSPIRGIGVAAPLSGNKAPAPASALSLTPASMLPGLGKHAFSSFAAPYAQAAQAAAAAGSGAAARVRLPNTAVAVPPAAPAASVPSPLSDFSQPSTPETRDAARSSMDEAAGLAAERSDPPGRAGSWDRFWSGSGELAEDSAGAAQAPSAKLAPRLTPAKAAAALAPAAAGLALPGAAHAAESLPPWAAKSLAVGAPTLHAGGVVLATWLLSRLVSRGLAALWKWKKWDPNAFLVARLGAKAALWAAGGTIALKSAGMTWGALAAGLGIGGLALTLSVKKFLGNFISGVTLFMASPFKIGERIRVGETDYTVKDMTFRNLVLQDQEGTFTLLDYTTLTSKPIGLYRRLEKRSAALSLLAGSLKEAGGGGFLRLVKALGAAALAGSLAWGGLKLHTAAAFSRPYLHGALALAAAWLASKGVGVLVRKLAKRYGWDQNVHALVRLVSIGLTWLLGGALALHLAGITWTALLAGAGVVGTALGIAATDLITNLLEASWMILTQPFRIGDKITVGDSEGVVSDMTLRYVVLESERGGRVLSTLIPYALFGESPLKVHKDYVRKSRLPA